MLYLTESDVRELLPTETAIDLIEGAFNRLATGEAINQPRRRMILPPGSTLFQRIADALSVGLGTVSRVVADQP